VTTIRLVHNAPLQELLPFKIRTTAVLPTAVEPPTTAFDGDATTVLAQVAMIDATIARTALCRLLRTTPRL